MMQKTFLSLIMDELDERMQRL